MRYTSPPSSLFADRRKEFIKKMKPGSVAIFFSHALMAKTADQHFPYRQDPGIFALSGLEQPDTILVLSNENVKGLGNEIAFILPQDPAHAIWNGDRLTSKEASKISGIKNIRTTDQWEKSFSKWMAHAKHIYLPAHGDDIYPAYGPANEKKIRAIRTLYPKHQFETTDSILRQMMMVKHKSELDLMRNAIEITHHAFDRILRNVRPGMREFEIEAELTYEITRHGGKHAFDPIIASGKDACTLHYIRNDKLIPKDSLVLIDFGAEYANMASDVTRTIPASGKFSKDQLKIYSAVLRVLNEVTLMMIPGMTLKQLNSEAGKLIEGELISLKILSKKEVRNQDPKSPLWKKYFMHGISHHLGYDVHDLSDREAPFKSGMVLTCEPGLYIPALKTGVRLENDILITRSKPQNLTSSIPIEPAEIESIMHS